MTRLNFFVPLVVAVFGAWLVVTVWTPRFSYSQADFEESRQKLPRPIVNTHDLMALFNKPLYTLLKEEMGKQPRDQDAWKTIFERGLQAAEVANLIALRKAPPEHADDWQELARDVQLAGLALASAAKAQDSEKTASGFERLRVNCNNCHEKVAPNKAPRLE
jgi:hypothetical protein